MRIKILIIDDEEPICEILKYNLELEGYDADYALSAEDAMNLDLSSYALFILDVMMEHISGFDFAKSLRNNPKTENTPIIFCTALDGEDSTVMGLNLGGDDYITKPFSINEVMARVRATLRRSQASQQYAYNVSRSLTEPDIVFKSLRIDRNDKLCYINGKLVPLTKTELEILLFFLTHRSRIYSREEIIHEVWRNDVVVSNRTIDTNITRLRKKIEPYGNYIATRPGFGYGFKEVQ
jgi:two-component system phosphate regulon response regulator PhoB